MSQGLAVAESQSLILKKRMHSVLPFILDQYHKARSYHGLSNVNLERFSGLYLELVTLAYVCHETFPGRSDKPTLIE